MSFRSKRQQVLAAGISVGSTEITAGTLTGKFVDLTDGAVVTVSNRHVYEGKPNKTYVVQPGRYDGGRVPADVIGVVKRLVEWDKPKPLPWWKRILCTLFGWLLEEWCIAEQLPNYLDAGVATWAPTEEQRTLKSGVYLDDGSILTITKTHKGDGILNRQVWKAGRTTGVTIGQVINDSATVKVWFGDRWRIFRDQVIVRGLARGGDSGSPVFLMEHDRPSEADSICGILFAGSSSDYVFCKYKYLESELKVRWAT